MNAELYTSLPFRAEHESIAGWSVGGGGGVGHRGDGGGPARVGLQSASGMKLIIIEI